MTGQFPSYPGSPELRQDAATEREFLAVNPGEVLAEISRRLSVPVQGSGGCDRIALDAAHQIECLPPAADGQEARKTALIHLIVLDAIRCTAQQAVGCGAWQPIETAPKDGMRIIGSFWSIRWADSHRKGDVVGCWYQPEFDAFISSCREMSMHNGYTFEDGTTKRLHSPVIEPITHWMPMPDGPAVPSTNSNTAKD